MPISRDEVLHVAHLAHVGLTEVEIATLADQLSSVLDHIAVLGSVDTDGVPPTSHVLPVDDAMRDDDVVPSWPPEAVLANAPNRLDDLFEVQAVFD